jgi:hypothetical protein
MNLKHIVGLIGAVLVAFILANAAMALLAFLDAAPRFGIITAGWCIGLLVVAVGGHMVSGWKDGE